MNIGVYCPSQYITLHSQTRAISYTARDIIIIIILTVNNLYYYPKPNTTFQWNNKNVPII